MPSQSRAVSSVETEMRRGRTRPGRISSFRPCQDLLNSVARQLEFGFGDLLRLLDDGVDDHDALPHQKAIERPANAFPPACAQLEQPTTEGARVRQSEVRADRLQKLGKPQEVRSDSPRPALNGGEDARVVELDRVPSGDVSKFANLVQLGGRLCMDSL